MSGSRLPYTPLLMNPRLCGSLDSGGGTPKARRDNRAVAILYHRGTVGESLPMSSEGRLCHLPPRMNDISCCCFCKEGSVGRDVNCNQAPWKYSLGRVAFWGG